MRNSIQLTQALADELGYATDRPLLDRHVAGDIQHAAALDYEDMPADLLPELHAAAAICRAWLLEADPTEQAMVDSICGTASYL